MTLFLKTCCRVINLKWGVDIIAIIYAVSVILAYFLTEIILEDFCGIRETEFFRQTVNTVNKIVCSTIFSASVAAFVAGNHLKIHTLFLPYVVIVPTLVLSSLCLAISLLKMGREIPGLFFIFIGAINIYFLMIVISRFVEIKPHDSKVKNNETLCIEIK